MRVVELFHVSSILLLRAWNIRRSAKVDFPSLFGVVVETFGACGSGRLSGGWVFLSVDR